MRSVPLYPYQREVIQRPLNSHTFLEGPAGTGKTTVGVERLCWTKSPSGRVMPSGRRRIE